MTDFGKFAVTAAAIPLLALATAPVALGQASVVAKQLDETVEPMRKAGMVQAARDVRGALDNKKSSDEAIYLIKGIRYQLTGFCDGDCRRLDISLFDGNNNKIAEHTTTDDKPVLNVTPKETGKYTLRVVMGECTVDPCDWGVRAYAPR